MVLDGIMLVVLGGEAINRVYEVHRRDAYTDTYTDLVLH